MEDQERNMESPDVEGRPVRGKSPRASELTIMIMGKVGKFRSFKISSRVFLWASLFLIGYMAASIFVFNLYFEERRTNRHQAGLLQQLQQEIKLTKRELHRSRQHLELKEEAIHDREALQEGPSTAQSSDSPMAQAEEPPVEKKKEENAIEPEKPVLQTAVDIEEMQVSQEGETLRVDFKLVNVKEADDPASGYVHIIAMNRANPPQFWAYPKVALQNGSPVHYKRGQLFFIKRFKTIHGEYLMDADIESPSSIRVIVYDHSGTLILKRDFEVEDVS